MKIVLQSRFAKSGLTYTVDVAHNRAVVVHRGGRAVAVGSEQDGEWTMCAGKPTLWQAALASIPAPAEVAPF